MNSSTFGQHEAIVPCAFKAVFSVAISVVALLSVIGNILVVTTVIKTQNLRTSTNYYITSMAVSDLLWVATNCPLYLCSRLAVLGHVELPSFACKLGNFLTYVSYSVSIASLVLITVDRFIATVFPMKVTRITKRMRTVVTVGTWILPMGTLFPYLHFSRTAEPDETNLCANDMSSILRIAYIIAAFVLYYCAPLIAIIILNTRIMRSLRRTIPVIQRNNLINGRRREQNRRIMKILIWINVLFFISWTPYYVSLFALEFLLKGSERKIRQILLVFFQIFLPMVCTSANPVILFTFSTNFHQALKNCLQHASDKCHLCLNLGQVANEGVTELQ